MPEHVIETKIQLRYDTYSNWQTSTLILKPGEVAIATFPHSTSISTSDSTPTNTPPAVGLKVGDGESYFYELPWVQAIAGDVYNWAKRPVKPTYAAGEIEGLQTFVEQYSGGGSGTPSAVARFYKLVRGTGNDSNKYYLQSRTDENDEWTIDTSIYIDLSQYAKLVSWVGENINDYFTLEGCISDVIQDEFLKRKYTDSQETGKVVTAVSQNNGTISVTKKTLALSELSGTLGVTNGGTGIDQIDTNEILVGNAGGTFSIRTIDNDLDTDNNLATNGAIKTYIATQTAGLTGAMHYIGEASVEINPTVNPRVDPNIIDYDFRNVRPGDVITYNTREYVWADGWRLLGDEGSYAVKGSIMNADIAAEANIAQSKIYGLTDALAGKVDVIEGKSLSTNDYTDAEKTKLGHIEDYAQVNAIEHIFVNDVERPITTIDGLTKSVALTINVFDDAQAEKLAGIQTGAQVNAIEHIFVNGTEQSITSVNNLAKSVNITFNPFTTEEKTKLTNIEAGAQVNSIETIKINGTSYTPDQNKEVAITINQASLNLDVIAGARVPDGNTYDDVDITRVNGVKILELARIAKSGDVSDLLQTNNSYIILNCGSSTDVID